MTTTLLTRRLSFRCTLILPHFMSKHVPLEIKRKQGTLVSFPVISDCSPPNFVELSRAIGIGVQRSQAFDLLWMKLKLNAAPKRNRSGRCSEVWEYQNQSCKGACTTFLVLTGCLFGSATKINGKKGAKIFWDKKVCYEKSTNSLGVLDY